MDTHGHILAAIIRPVLSYVSRRRLPQHEGQIQIKGIQSLIRVSRDSLGIPRIHATTRRDLFFAQGFVHAQDRLWQMEVNRRSAAGRLAEIFGKQALGTDRLTRTLGFGRLARESWAIAPEWLREDVRAYTDGVNAFLAKSSKLPVEFSIIRHHPEKWTVIDSICFGRLMMWLLSHVWIVKLLRAKLIERLGPELAAELELDYPGQNPVTLPEGISYDALRFDKMVKECLDPLLGRTMFSGTQGSNSWVIPGKNSTTGMPLLCNDMHLPISSPSLWYFNHLICPIGSGNGRDYHTAGVSLPGFPYVLVGHNEKIAWGATVSFVDNEDLFVEKINQSDKTYLFMDDWRPLKSVREEIAVRGEPEYIEEVLLTHHGPIISNLIPSDDTSLSLQSAALLISEGIEGFGLLGEAHNWTEFTEAICAIRVPPLNLMYADVEGNIGYYVSGTVPIRAKGKGLVPVPGWNGEYEWNGSIPFSEMPHAFNPDIDYLVNANNKIVGADYPHYLGSSWRNGFRARRIKQLLETNGKRTKENCCAMQNDVVSSLGIEFVDFLTNFETEDPKANISLELIRTWDGSMDNQATGAAVYKVLLEMLARRILRPKLGEALLAEYLGEGFEPTLYSTNELQGHWPVVALRLLDNPQSKWWDNEEHLVWTLTKSLADTTRYLEHKLGNNPAYWYWSRIHEIKFDHTLANNPLLDAIFSLGPFPIGGDQDTIAQSSILNEVPGDNIAASYRQIIDLSDLSRSIAMHAPGQSGHLGSSNYSDLVHPWLNGSYYEMSWDIADSISTPEHLLEMLPE